MKNKLITLFILLMCATIGSAANGPLDGKTTIDGVHNLIWVALILFVLSFIFMKLADGVSALSIILMGLSAMLTFEIAQIYNNGSLVQILPDSSIQMIHNDSTSQFFQFLALVMMGLTFIQIIMLVLAKKKPIFINENFGDGFE